MHRYTAPLLFPDNETNRQRVFSVANNSLYVKDAFHRYLVHSEHAAVNWLRPLKIALKEYLNDLIVPPDQPVY